MLKFKSNDWKIKSKYTTNYKTFIGFKARLWWRLRLLTNMRNPQLTASSTSPPIIWTSTIIIRASPWHVIFSIHMCTASDLPRAISSGCDGQISIVHCSEKVSGHFELKLRKSLRWITSCEVSRNQFNSTWPTVLEVMEGNTKLMFLI